MFIEFTGKNVKPQSSAAGGWPGVWEVGSARPFARESRAGGTGRRRFDRNGAGARTHAAPAWGPP